MIQLIVGYTMVKLPGTDEFLKDIKDSVKAPANYKDPMKIQEYVEKETQKRIETASRSPYLGTFGKVYLMDTSVTPTGLHFWACEKRAPFGSQPSMCSTIAAFLKSKWPEAFDNNSTLTFQKSEIMFVGFEIKRFLKVLGLECSMPGVNTPLPPVLWYGSDAGRDVGEMIAPKSLNVDLSLALKSRGFWRQGWEPCENAEDDMRLSVEILTQLNFLRKPIAE